MPEEGKYELETDCKLVEQIYTDREVGGKFWRKETLESFILKGCDDERVILLMGSDCSTEDLMMDDDMLSDWSSQVLFNVDIVNNPVIIGEEQIDDREEHGEKSNISQGTSKEAETTNNMQSPAIVDNSSYCTEHYDFQDQLNEDIISYNNELDKEFLESISISRQYSGTLPYSGSISLRSTSSTASTQSFAFPILAQEYNSSPVRMPKPNKRQLFTKPKHWTMKMGWVCCKF